MLGPDPGTLRVVGWDESLIAAADDGIATLTTGQCLRLLASHDLGRIAFSVEGQPEIFPVNYGMDGEVVVFRTAPGTKLKWAKASRVAFEIDGWDSATGSGWSVVVKGVVREATIDNDPFTESIRSVPVVPLAPGARPFRLAIYPRSMSGRAFKEPAGPMSPDA